MLADAFILASCSFGSAVFGLVVGLVAAGSTRRGAATFPPTHVSFEPELSDEECLHFLDLAAQAVRDGRLRQADKLQNDGATNKAAKPGPRLEK